MRVRWAQGLVLAIAGWMMLGGGGAAIAATGYRKPVEMKLLILSTNGEEAGLAALQSFLDFQGTPYEVMKLAAGQTMPRLHDGSKGFYQGVILTLGNLGYCNPDCKSALDQDGWNRLDSYTREYGVRTISYYTYPEPRYGLKALGSVSTTAASPLKATLTPAAASIFRDLRFPATVEITGAFAYLAEAAPNDGETTEPLLRAGDQTLAVLHKTVDGRETLALTFDNNQNLWHSLLLQRGLIDWVTRGVHLGWRKSWLAPQVDDIFLANYLFDLSMKECAVAGGPEVEPGSEIPCKVLRIGASDLEETAAWQRKWRQKPQFAQFRLGMAYNGFGVKSDEDPLLAAARNVRNEFSWVSHTYSHHHLDCYAATTEGCRGANVEEGLFEVQENLAAGKRFGLTIDAASMVTPQISGLHNASFLAGAAAGGIRFLVSDTSRPEFYPPHPNTAQNSDVPGVYFIPRRPTGIFYNAADGEAGRPGSEPDEYNFLFGPEGVFKLADGTPFYSAPQDYEAILDRETELTVKYLLRGEMYPLMFHQANLWQYRPGRSLLTDLVGKVLARYESISNLPVLSPEQTKLGELLVERNAYWDAEVKGTVWPEGGVVLTSKRPAVVPLTGVCEETCERYGPYAVASVAIGESGVREVRVAGAEPAAPLE